MKKRLLCIVLALVLCLGLTPAAALAAETSGTCGDNVTWTLDEGGTLTIGGSGAMKDFPTGPHGGAATPWYYGLLKDITAIVIGDGVTYIGAYAFLDCAEVTSVTIAGSVTVIGQGAFSGCTKLPSVAIPSGVTSIGMAAFSGCTALTDISISDSVTSIGYCAFYNCSSLDNVVIPESVTSIDGFAFNNCTKLSSVDLPGGATVGSQAFDGTPWLTQKGEFAVVDGILLRYQGTGGTVTVPEGVTIIGGGAFNECTGLTGVTLPQGVTAIGEYAFAGCSALTGLTIPDTVTSIGEYAFGGSGLTSVIVPESVTKLDQRVFSSCQALTAVTLPSGLTSLEESMFYRCEKLAGITIPQSVTDIGKYAFEGCSALTNVVLPEMVTVIEEGTFSGCTSLTSVTIPASVTEIKWYAFYGCTGLKDVTYGGVEAQWNALEMTKGNVALESATVHCTGTGQLNPPVAHASAQTVTVDGKPVEFQMYALKDASGNDTNYIKLRDMAYVLSDTKAQFSVGYDQQSGTITATTGGAYEKNGTEMTANFGGADKECVKTTLTIHLDGKPVQLEAITLTDDAGGGYNYCKLRDLGQLLNFNVTWDGSGIVVESDKPYTG